jgi:LPS-assembly protein
MKVSTTLRLAAGCAFWAAAAWAQQTVAPSRPMTGASRSEANEPVWHDAPPAKAAPAQPAAAKPVAAQPAPAPAAAAAPARSGGLAALRAPANPLGGVLDVQADDLSYDAARRLVIAKGNVKVSRGTDSVAADYAEVDTAAETVAARGHLRIEYQGNVWEGEKATYNFKTGQGDFGAFAAYAPPFHVAAEGARRLSLNLMELEGVMLTTCEPDRPEYSIRASSATLEDNRYLRAKNVRFQLGPVPFFWVPYLGADVEELANFEFTPGMSSDMGAFLLMAYNYPVNDVFKSRTHFDLREKRGVAVGQDVIWQDPDGRDFAGQVRLYYANDQEPWRDDDQRAEREELVDADRYWLHLDDVHNLTDRDYLISELNYVSDPWMLHDFFDDEYQRNVQPENRLTLSHRGDRYTAGVLMNMRLNDFYGNVDRLPEVFLDVNRQRIFGTPFFYESENTFGYLGRVYPDGSDDERYNAFRFDTKHMVYWPTRHFGFLSLIPRAGYRGTYYSKTRESAFVTNVVAVTNELGQPVGTTNEVTELVADGDAVWRSLPEVGAESSFKAFGDLYDGPTGIEEDEDLRHVFEPYADYTLRFEPNALPEDLWQFDSIDKLDERNDLRLGLRNYLQTRRGGGTHNLVYADVFTTLQLDPDEDEDVFRFLGFKAELRPWSWLSWDFDGVYDAQTNELDSFSTQVEVRQQDVFTFGLDYRYKLDAREAVAGDLVVFPEARWSGRVYARMDLEESNLEEHSYYVIHRTRCLGIGLGVRIRPEQGSEGEDDYTVWFRIWPLAIPSFSSSLGH